MVPQWQLGLVRALFRSIGLVSPALLALLGEKIFASPRKLPPSKEELRQRERAERFWVPSPEGELALFCWGKQGAATDDKKPKALLYHGWEGRGTQLRAFVEPLVDKGYVVCALDAPAHGESPGKEANIFLFSGALRSASETYGPFDLVICHSFGGAALFHAMTHGMKVSRPVVICTPFSVEEVLERIMTFFHLFPHVQEKLKSRWRERFGERYDEISPDFYIPSIREHSLLIVHDEDDAEVPISDGERLAEAFVNSRFMKTRGLGHRRVLKNPEVIKEVLLFAQREEPMKTSLGPE